MACPGGLVKIGIFYLGAVTHQAFTLHPHISRLTLSDSPQDLRRPRKVRLVVPKIGFRDKGKVWIFKWRLERMFWGQALGGLD